ncbi:MAG: hypothetical protein HUU28_08725 [Planctomycetaceae bacterium]|nr:hypothetical protein [Planctomycetaceae bacterium]
MLLAAFALACLPAVPQEPEVRDEDSIVVPAPLEVVWETFAQTPAIRTNDLDKFRLWYTVPESLLALFSPLEINQSYSAVSEDSPFHSVVLTFSQLQSDRTRVRYAILGNGTGEFFDRSASECDEKALQLIQGTLAKFDEARAQAEAESRAAWDVVKSWSGGVWIAEARDAKGEVVRACARVEPILGGTFVREDFWEGNADALTLHSRSIYGLDPKTRSVHSWTFGASGWQREASVHLDGTAAIELRSLRASRRDPRPVVRVELRGNDAHAERGLEYRRVAELPAGWTLKSSSGETSVDMAIEEPLSAPESALRASLTLGLDVREAWNRLIEDEGLKKAVLRGIDVTVPEGELIPVARAELEPQRAFLLDVLSLNPVCDTDTEPILFQFEPADLDTCVLTISVRMDPKFAAEGKQALSSRLEHVLARARELAPYEPKLDTLERLRALVGGTFEATTVVPTGETLRARTTWESWSHSTFAWHGRLGPMDAAELPEHTLMLYAVDPERGPRFWKFGADGSVATGAVLPHGESGVAHDWHSSSPSGLERHIYVTITPDDRAYSYVAQPSRSEATRLVDLKYSRQ